LDIQEKGSTNGLRTGLYITPPIKKAVQKSSSDASQAKGGKKNRRNPEKTKREKRTETKNQPNPPNQNGRREAQKGAKMTVSKKKGLGGLDLVLIRESAVYRSHGGKKKTKNAK